MMFIPPTLQESSPEPSFQRWRRAVPQGVGPDRFDEENHGGLNQQTVGFHGKNWVILALVVQEKRRLDVTLWWTNIAIENCHL